jgi:hypothetical protein
MRTVFARVIPGLLIAVCLLWYWPRRVPACAGEESPSCKLVAEALNSTTKLKVGMLRADLEKDFDPDGGISGQDRGMFTYKRCHYIKIEVEFEAHEISSGSQASSPTDRVSKISRPYLAYPVSD